MSIHLNRQPTKDWVQAIEAVELVDPGQETT
jgi:hypothetical protein